MTLLSNRAHDANRLSVFCHHGLAFKLSSAAYMNFQSIPCLPIQSNNVSAGETQQILDTDQCSRELSTDGYDRVVQRFDNVLEVGCLIAFAPNAHILREISHNRFQ